MKAITRPTIVFLVFFCFCLGMFFGTMFSHVASPRMAIDQADSDGHQFQAQEDSGGFGGLNEECCGEFNDMTGGIGGAE